MSKILDSGGFGCVYYPQLECDLKKSKSKSKSRYISKYRNKEKSKTRKVSKLMLKKYAEQEFDEIQNIANVLKNINNFGDYFVLKNISICQPGAMPSTVLENFNKSCRALTKQDINSKNINSNLDKLSILNIPHAGISIDKYISSGIISVEFFVHFNQKMISLLKNGIIPMNQLGVYHSDLKPGNLMINQSLKQIRIIDWGLSVVQKNNKVFKSVPSNWDNRPLQFNVPFENIFFNQHFQTKMQHFLTTGTCETNSGINFVESFVKFWCDKRGKGHLKYIGNILHNLGLISNLNDKNTINFISNYLVEIIHFFAEIRKGGKFSFLKYLNDIYKHKIDIWGFIMCYWTFLERLHLNKQSLNYQYQIIYDKLKTLFVTYLYTPLDLNNFDINDFKKKLVKDLSDLNKKIEPTLKITPFTKEIDSHINSTETMPSPNNF